MLSMYSHHGGEMPPTQRDGLANEFNVSFRHSVVGGEVLDLAARQSMALHRDAHQRSSEGIEGSPYVTVPGLSGFSDELDHRLLIVKWGVDELEDVELSNEISKVTGIECHEIFVAARSLVRSIGLIHDPEELDIMVTSSDDSFGMHKDNPKEDDPDPKNFVRDILHLNGDRKVSFVNDNNQRFQLGLNPGDAYSFSPFATYHQPSYSGDCTALIVQGWVKG